MGLKELTPRRREWIRQMELRLMQAGNWYGQPYGEEHWMFCGKPIDNAWPTDAMIDEDFRQWRIQEDGRLDVADPKTFEGWVQCADGRTLWEYAKDGGKPQ